MIDVEALASPLAEDNPCGDNLEYDPDFMSLEADARGKPEQEFGDTKIEAEEPDWKGIRARSLALLERTRDLRPAVLLARALTHEDGVAGLAQGLDLIARMVDGLWDQVHPQLDPEDDNDPTMRVNALSALVDEEGLLRDLRTAEFVSVQGFGPCTVRHVEHALGLVDTGPESGDFSITQIEGMLSDAASRGEANHAQLALDHLRSLTTALDERVGSAQSIDARPLISRLTPLANLYAKATGGEDDSVAEQEGEVPAGGQASGGRGVGELRSREDAIRLLGKVCDFLERSEPSNPAPLLIKRAQRLMTMSFVDIMREMAPEGMDSVSKIAGLDAGGGYSESEG